MEGVSLCCRFALSSIDMEQRDYDSRTALHVAAAEGELQPRLSLYRQNCLFFFKLNVCQKK